MVKEKISGFAFLFGFLLISMPLVLAEDFSDGLKFHPNIDFKAQIDSVYVIQVSNALTAKAIKSMVVEVGQDGRETVNFGTDAEMVNIAVFLINNQTAFFKNRTYLEKTNAGTFSTDELILLNIRDGVYNSLTFEGEEGAAPIDYTPETAEDENMADGEGSEETAEDEESEDAVTGSVVSNIADFSKSNFVYLIIGLIVIVGGIVLFMMRGKMHFGSRNSESQPRTVKLSELRAQSHDNLISSAEKRLENAEKELKEAQEEIGRIKNGKSELSEAEEEFKKAKEKLDALRDQ